MIMSLASCVVCRTEEWQWEEAAEAPENPPAAAAGSAASPQSPDKDGHSGGHGETAGKGEHVATPAQQTPQNVSQDNILYPVILILSDHREDGESVRQRWQEAGGEKAER